MAMGKTRKNTINNIPHIDEEMFVQHISEWGQGYGEYDEVFSEQEQEFIRNNLQTTQNHLYRIRDLDVHYENGEMVLDENPLNWKKGDSINFHGELKSFSKSENSVLEFGADTTNPLVIFRTNGNVQNFPLDEYPHDYQWLHETLVPSENWVVDKVTDVSQLDKYKLKHEIGGNVWYEERPIFIVDIVNKQ